jgi:hypothetical protein
MSNPPAFFPGSQPSHARLLARFRPSLPEGSTRGWLETLESNERGWLLDPFGISPAMAREAAQAGWRVLVCANNPIHRFLFELTSQPPAASELRAALAELSASRRGTERLEPHLRQLYRSHCAACGGEVEVESYLWERGQPTPFGRVYTCRGCGASGEFNATAEDAALAARVAGSHGLHLSRALERVAPAADPDRTHAEEALNAYLPRPLYVLFTLINKLDGLSLSAERRRLLMALLLHALDMGTTLSAHPSEREHPRQLVTPARFREANLWLALEQAVDLIGGREAGPQTPLTVWPNLPGPEGGICLFEGPVRELAEQIGDLKIGAVVTALPRPNQAFWTLSALWAGWLWGSEAAAAFKSVLRRQRYDFAWHTAALQNAFQHVGLIVAEKTPVFLLTGEAEAGLLAAVVSAAHTAHFRLEGVALRASEGQAQIHLAATGKAEPPSHLPSAAVAQLAAQRLLETYGQPCSYLRLYGAALVGLAAKGDLPAQKEQPAENYNTLQFALRESFSYREGFLRFGGGAGPETGQYWLREEQASQPPLADRLEKHLVNYLVRHGLSSRLKIEEAACKAFPGLCTPDANLVEAILSSYALASKSQPGLVDLRPEDAPARRKADLAALRDLLAQLGDRMGYESRGDAPLEWLQGSEVRYRFYPTMSAVLSSLLTVPARNMVHVMVLPGGRAGLVDFKLRADPRLKKLAEGWQFMKIRLLRRMVAGQQVQGGSLQEILALDPITDQDGQMRFL